FFAAEMLKAQKTSLEGRSVVVSGSGNVAIYAIEKIHELGGKVVACSDTDGYVVDENGLNLELVKDVKERHRDRISTYCNHVSTARHVTDGSIWDVPCQVALPCATQNELTIDGAYTLVKNGCEIVAEGANMPTMPEAVTVLQEAGVRFGPGKAANAGGVATSALEMTQNASRASWTHDYTEQRLSAV